MYGIHDRRKWGSVYVTLWTSGSMEELCISIGREHWYIHLLTLICG